MAETVLVLGASETTWRYSYIATNMLLDYGHRVLLVGKRPGLIRNEPILTDLLDNVGRIDTVTLYLNPDHQRAWYERILELRPARVIFNPGTENPEFEQQLAEFGIEPQQACTLVLLRTGQYEG